MFIIARDNRPRVKPLYPPTPPGARRGTPRLDPVLTRCQNSCAVSYARLFDLMTAQRSGPRVLAGWHALLRYLNDVLGMRDQYGYRIRRRHVEMWIAKYHFPFLPGIKQPHARYQCVTLERAVDAWLLSRPRNGVRELFRFYLDNEQLHSSRGGPAKAWSGPTAPSG